MANTLYNHIGTGYNSNRKADPVITERLYKHLAPMPGGKYLDIGCGTGNYTISLAERTIDICGLDPSQLMLETGRSRNSSINWHIGSAEQLPFQSDYFHGICGVLTLHHWPDHPAAFKEIYRVLKPGGKAVFFTSAPEQMTGYWLNHYFPEMMRASIQQMPSIEQLTAAAGSAHLQKTVTELYSVTPELQDFFLYAGKDRPHLYLNGDVRKGISSFAALSVAHEVATGLAQLSADIASGKFSVIAQSFENALGDYLFVVFEK